MRILHVVPTYLPAVRYGGPIFAVHGLASGQAAAGHEVHVFTTDVDGPGDSDVPLDRPVMRDRVAVHYFPSRRLRRLYVSPPLGRRCRAEVGGFDVVHLHSVFLYPTAVAARAARKAGTPVVLSPRGMLVRDLIAGRSTLLKRAWIALVERRNLAGAAAIHLTSQEERRALADLDLDLAPTIVIPNGVDEPAAAGDSASDDVSRAVVNGIDVLAFGRISWKKGLDTLLRAVASLPGTRLVIAGNDEEAFAPALRALAATLGIADRVAILARQVGAADREALYRAARVAVLASPSENFGNVVTEAMIRGRPVLVTRGVGAADIVTESGGGLVVAPDAEALAAGLAGLLADRARAEAMGAAGAAHVRAHLTWASVARDMVAAYEGLQGR